MIKLMRNKLTIDKINKEICMNKGVNFNDSKKSEYTLSRRAFVALAAAAPLMLTGCGQSSSADQSDNASANSSADSSTQTTTPSVSYGSVDDALLTAPLDNGFSSGQHHATITVANYGTIELRLNADVAPITVSNFAQLVNDKFYDGLTFHRIIKDFMVQGGDPNGDGSGGSPRKIKGEFAANGIKNPLKHERGVISMARANDNNSASSQFFIMHKTTESLDGNYAAFGKVTSGLEVIDALAENVPVQDSNGTVAKANQPVIESIVMVD